MILFQLLQGLDKPQGILVSVSVVFHDPTFVDLIPFIFEFRNFHRPMASRHVQQKGVTDALALAVMGRHPGRRCNLSFSWGVGIWRGGTVYNDFEAVSNKDQKNIQYSYCPKPNMTNTFWIASPESYVVEHAPTGLKVTWSEAVGSWSNSGQKLVFQEPIF